MRFTLSALAVLALCFQVCGQEGASLKGTSPLEPEADFSGLMVAGIDRFLLKEIEKAKAGRSALWPGDMEAHREKLGQIIGAVDPREAVKALELVSDTETSALIHETETAKVLRVRWPVLPGVHGEGLLIQPKGKALASIVYLPDADTPPEKLVDEMLLTSGCEVIIPTLIDRETEFSGNERFGIQTNIPHREWIYRQAFELGRHIIGYEVQKVMAAVDWLKSRPQATPVLVAGSGEGGMIALYSAALDPRIDGAYVAGYFGPREKVWEEPIYRNVFGLLPEFGDAEVAALIAPRRLVIHHLGFPSVSHPRQASGKERPIAAPGKLGKPEINGVQQEVARAKALAPGDWLQLYNEEQGIQEIVTHLLPAEAAQSVLSQVKKGGANVILPKDKGRQERQIRELENYTQGLLVRCEEERNKEFWKPLPLQDLSSYDKATVPQRERFWNEVIGRFPDPDVAMKPQSRLVKKTDKVSIYEVKLEVWEEVFAWGWLCLPNDLKEGEKRPVVVCQHGLEGIPEDTFNEDQSSKAWGAYKAFSLRLAEQGYVTFAPHNPYRGMDAFRGLQRKLNPLGKTLFSVIVGQHQRILEWLKTQPFTDSRKIAFYGLSYGGKSAMRIPALLPDYCLSICSGDFNEWVRKCVMRDLPFAYIYTKEYEIWEWNMGRTFNYAEMAALIAPRPFMVERGHNDGVGIDEWVDYEFAKVRRLYNKLGIGERTVIEHFNGPHTIHGVGTYEFLRKQLLSKQP